MNLPYGGFSARSPKKAPESVHHRTGRREPPADIGSGAVSTAQGSDAQEPGWRVSPGQGSVTTSLSAYSASVTACSTEALRHESENLETAYRLLGHFPTNKRKLPTSVPI